MSIAQKQALSALIVAAVSTVLAILQAYVVHLPTELAIPLASFLITAAHIVPTLGTAAKIDDVASAKARVIVTDILDSQDAQGRP
jgi:hypothetical protein